METSAISSTRMAPHQLQQATAANTAKAQQAQHAQQAQQQQAQKTELPPPVTNMQGQRTGAVVNTTA